MKDFGPARLAEEVLARGLCINCGACVSLCPYFRSHRGRIAMMFPCERESGRCHAYCPKTEVDLEAASRFVHGTGYPGHGIGQYREIAASRAAAPNEDSPVQSGGTVTALIAGMLEAGAIDAAVLTGRDGILPVPAIITDPAGVRFCGGSKYAASPTLSALNRAITEGYSKIALVGTPCQILAATQMRIRLTEQGHPDPVALTVGLFCTWALDYRKMEKILAARTDINSIISMDIPPPPAAVMEVRGIRDSHRIPLEEIRGAIPESCGYCADMTAEFADISVGALEGSPGKNSMVIRTIRGADSAASMIQKGRLLTEPYPEGSLRALAEASSGKRTRALSRADAAGMLNNTGESGSYLRLNAGTLAGILAR